MHDYIMGKTITITRSYLQSLPLMKSKVSKAWYDAMTDYDCNRHKSLYESIKKEMRELNEKLLKGELNIINDNNFKTQ